MPIPLSRRLLLGLAPALALGLPLTARAETAPRTAPGPDAGAQVSALLAAMAAGDAPAIRAAFAPEAQQAYGDAAPKGGAAFAAWLESDIIAAMGRVDDPVLVVDGDAVVVTGIYHNATGYRSPADFLFHTSATGITFLQMRY